MSPTTRSPREASLAYVPPLQRTEGQQPPIAAHAGLSYMAFDQEGDAGTAAAIQDARARGDRRGRGPARYRHDRQVARRPDQDQMGHRVPRLRRVRELRPRVEQPQGAAGRRGAAAALYRVRAADLFRGAVQRHLARPRARRHRSDPAHQRAGQPPARPLFPAGAARRAAHRRVLPGPLTPTAPNAWTGSACRWRT